MHAYTQHILLLAVVLVMKNEKCMKEIKEITCIFSKKKECRQKEEKNLSTRAMMRKSYYKKRNTY